MTTPLKLALFPWVKSIKGSIERIAEILNHGDIRVDVCQEEPNWANYDGAILNNDFRPLPIPRITYLTGLSVRRALSNIGYTKARLKHEGHLGVWTNCNTSAVALTQAGVPAQHIYRPYPVHIQDSAPSMPAKARVLWYWKPDWAYCDGMDQEIHQVMLSVANEGTEIWVISNKHAPVCGLPNHPNIKPLGRCKFSEILPEVRGMVRLTGDYDWGRSNFDVIGAGRFTLNLNAWEFESTDGAFEMPGPTGIHRGHAMSTPNMQEAVPIVNRLLRDGFDYEAIHRYASNNFREEPLRDRWQSQIRRLFS
ncbi:MAG: hypothetical protein ACO32Q_06340 [Burkholderiaceae bacterium]|jgi:hypothetical protein